jgi:hypothetical protein
MIMEIIQAKGPFERGATNNNCFFLSAIAALNWQMNIPPLKSYDSHVIINGRSYNADDLKYALYDFLLNDERRKAYCAQYPVDAATYNFSDASIIELRDSAFYRGGNDPFPPMSGISAFYALSEMTGQPTLCQGSSISVPPHTYYKNFLFVPGHGLPPMEFITGIAGEISRENYAAEQENCRRIIISQGVNKLFDEQYTPEMQMDDEVSDERENMKERLYGDPNDSMYAKIFEMGTKACKESTSFEMREAIFFPLNADYDEYKKRQRDAIIEGRIRFIDQMQQVEQGGVALLAIGHDDQHFRALLRKDKSEKSKS